MTWYVCTHLPVVIVCPSAVGQLTPLGDGVAELKFDEVVVDTAGDGTVVKDEIRVDDADAVDEYTLEVAADNTDVLEGARADDTKLERAELEFGGSGLEVVMIVVATGLLTVGVS